MDLKVKLLFAGILVLAGLQVYTHITHNKELNTVRQELRSVQTSLDTGVVLIQELATGVDSLQRVLTATRKQINIQKRYEQHTTIQRNPFEDLVSRAAGIMGGSNSSGARY